MTPETIISVGQQALVITALLAAPMLLAALAAGLLIGMFQAATQINEMTLSFIPKLLVLAGALYFGGGWMLRVLVGYSEGGPMAIMCTAAHPEKVAGLVLYGAYAKRVWPHVANPIHTDTPLGVASVTHPSCGAETDYR